MFEFGAYEYGMVSWGCFTTADVHVDDMLFFLGASGDRKVISREAEGSAVEYFSPWSCGSDADAELAIRQAVERGDVILLVRGGVGADELKRRVADLEKKVDDLTDPWGFRAWAGSAPFRMVNIEHLKPGVTAKCSLGKCFRVVGDEGRGWVLPDGSRKSDADMLVVFRADADRGDYVLVNDRG